MFGNNLEERVGELERKLDRMEFEKVKQSILDRLRVCFPEKEFWMSLGLDSDEGHFTIEYWRRVSGTFNTPEPHLLVGGTLTEIKAFVNGYLLYKEGGEQL